MNTLNTVPRRLRAVAALAGVGLLAAACGGDDDSSSAETVPAASSEPAADAESADSSSDDSMPPSTEADATDESSATESTATESTATESTATGDDSAATDEAGADAFPVTIDHKYGETTIEAEPQRVVSVGFAEHDGLLALGVIPVGVRDWYGEQPYATWPWAQDELGDAEPEVIAADALNFEQIAAMDPDLIIGVSSGMTEDDYATLSAIAPTVAQPGEYNDYGTPWQEQFEIAAQATGRTAEAEQVLADLDVRFAAAREANPGFEGATAAVAFTYEDQPGAYASQDNRSEIMMDLGFVIPPEYDELAGDEFWFSVSPEELSTLDQDVVVWIGSTDADFAAIAAMPLRPSMRAVEEGREVVADPLVSGAFSHASPLSLDYVLDELVDDLALAVDGDPSTVVPSAELLDGGSSDPSNDDASGNGFSGDEQAAADAWTVVFDSTTSFDDKAPHLEDADALRATVESYETASGEMGGISLEPTAVAVDGDVATVTYDVLFGGTAAYDALQGEIARVDGVWVVGRDEFCSFMASARNACPTA